MFAGPQACGAEDNAVVSGVINLPFMMQRVLSHSCLEKLQVLPLHRGLGNHIIQTWSNITPPAADPRERPPGHVFFGLFPSLNWSGDRVRSGDDVEILHSCRKGMSGGTSVAQHDTAHSPCCTQGFSNRYRTYPILFSLFRPCFKFNQTRKACFLWIQLYGDVTDLRMQ